MRSPLHDDLRAKGADFVEEAGALVARSFGDPANEYLALRRIVLPAAFGDALRETRAGRVNHRRRAAAGWCARRS